MTDQLDIHGNLVPTTWDGEPLYSTETVREGLFDPTAFQQVRGQTTWDDPDGCYSVGEMRYKREKRHDRGECDEDCEFCVS